MRRFFYPTFFDAQSAGAILGWECPAFGHDAQMVHLWFWPGTAVWANDYSPLRYHLWEKLRGDTGDWCGYWGLGYITFLGGMDTHAEGAGAIPSTLKKDLD
jgi:hypothetical protein